MKRIHSTEINDATKAKLAKTEDGDDGDEDDTSGEDDRDDINKKNEGSGTAKNSDDGNSSNGFEVDDEAVVEEDGEEKEEEGEDKERLGGEHAEGNYLLERNGISDAQDYRRLLPSIPSSSSFTLLPLRRTTPADSLYCVYEPTRSLCHCSFNAKQRTISNSCGLPGLRVSLSAQLDSDSSIDYDLRLGSHKSDTSSSSSTRLTSCCGNSSKWRLFHNENYELCKVTLFE